MENNVNFNKDLRFFYLSSLADRNEREEFMRFYHTIESYLEELVHTSNDIQVLSRVQNIISYRTKALVKEN